MNPAYGALWKPSRTARKLRERKARVKLDTFESQEKAKARKRDGRCRFPLCGCQRLKLRTEVAHGRSKSVGGGSSAPELVLLCTHRHQHGRVSFHAGTLRAKFLTAKKFNGPVAWDVDVCALALMYRGGAERWREVARESSIGIIEPLQGWQYDVLHTLAEMAL